MAKKRKRKSKGPKRHHKLKTSAATKSKHMPLWLLKRRLNKVQKTILAKGG